MRMLWMIVMIAVGTACAASLDEPVNNAVATSAKGESELGDREVTIQTGQGASTPRFKTIPKDKPIQLFLRPQLLREEEQTCLEKRASAPCYLAPMRIRIPEFTGSYQIIVGATTEQEDFSAADAEEERLSRCDASERSLWVSTLTNLAQPDSSYANSLTTYDKVQIDPDATPDSEKSTLVREPSPLLLIPLPKPLPSLKEGERCTYPTTIVVQCLKGPCEPQD